MGENHSDIEKSLISILAASKNGNTLTEANRTYTDVNGGSLKDNLSKVQSTLTKLKNKNVVYVKDGGRYFYQLGSVPSMDHNAQMVQKTRTANKMKKASQFRSVPAVMQQSSNQPNNVNNNNRNQLGSSMLKPSSSAGLSDQSPIRGGQAAGPFPGGPGNKNSKATSAGSSGPVLRTNQTGKHNGGTAASVAAAKKTQSKNAAAAPTAKPTAAAEKPTAQRQQKPSTAHNNNNNQRGSGALQSIPEHSSLRHAQSNVEGPSPRAVGNQHSPLKLSEWGEPIRIPRGPSIPVISIDNTIVQGY